MVRWEAILERCRAGDREALDELIRRWEGKLFYYVRRLVADEPDAWDVLQQTWVRVLNGIGKVRDSGKLVPWLYRVARNTAISHRKSLLARQGHLDRDAIVEDLADMEVLETDWTAEEVHRGMNDISASHRDVLTLFFLQDLTIKEIAEVAGVSEGTVKSRLFYGKKALREVLENVRSRS
jgi:RNA polymerase sigma-70 factor (ECF subfamily)